MYGDEVWLVRIDGSAYLRDPQRQSHAYIVKDAAHIVRDEKDGQRRVGRSKPIGRAARGLAGGALTKLIEELLAAVGAAHGGAELSRRPGFKTEEGRADETTPSGEKAISTPQMSSFV